MNASGVMEIVGRRAVMLRGVERAAQGASNARGDVEELLSAGETAEMFRSAARLRALVTEPTVTEWGASVEAMSTAKPMTDQTVLSWLTSVDATMSGLAIGIEGTRSNSTAPKAYGSTATELPVSFTKQDLKTAWVPAFASVTNDAFRDKGTVAEIVRAVIADGVMRGVEDQVLNGDGTGEAVGGITNAANVAALSKGSDTIAAAVTKAAQLVREHEYGSNLGVVFHPTDAGAVALDTDVAAVRAAWDLIGVARVAVTPLIPQGTVLVGDFSTVRLFAVAPLSVSVSDSHGTGFIEGVSTLLAETRVAVTVPYGEAFAAVDLAA